MRLVVITQRRHPDGPNGRLLSVGSFGLGQPNRRCGYSGMKGNITNSPEITWIVRLPWTFDNVRWGTTAADPEPRLDSYRP